MGKGTLDKVQFDKEGFPIPQTPKQKIDFDDEGLPVPVKKKETGLTKLLGGAVKSALSNFPSNGGASVKPKVYPVSVSSKLSEELPFIQNYNRQFESVTGLPDLNLGSTRP